MRRFKTLVWLIVPLMLLGCTRQVSDYGLSIVDDTVTYSGKYTGTLEDGLPTGTGKFVIKIDETKNWVYEGAFSEGKPSGEASVEGYPCTIKVGIYNDAGNYSGPVNDLQPNGEGTFVSDLGWTYVGNFDKGVVSGTGKMTNFPFDLLYEEKTVKGTYSGDVLNGVPDGTGDFTVQTLDINMSYSGTWSSGAMSGDGMLSSNVYTIHFSDVDRTGEYEGAVVDGKAEGQGIFKAENTSGYTYTYEGEFVGGLFDGYGELDFDSEDVTDYKGHFTAGDNTPTKSELLVYLGTIKDFVSYSVSDTSISFIDSNENLFMVEDKSELEGKINEDITLNELYKTPTEYGDQIIKFSTKKIIQIREEVVYGETITWFIVEDNAGNRAFVLCPGALPDVNKNDRVTVYGVPINLCSYQNSFNGSVNAYVVYGVYVTK